jgi:hypothetical protein
MAYGTVKVDNITFTNGGLDQTISVSGIVDAVSGNITATGTISGDILLGGTVVSGATVTGTVGQFGTLTGNTAGFTTVTGTTITGITANFVSGVFTTQLSGTTITGNTGQFATVTGNTAGFTTITGTTVTGITSNFVSGVFTTQISGTTITGNNIQGSNIEGISGKFTTSVSGNLYISSGNVTVISGSGDVRPYGLYSFPPTTSASGFQLITYGNGTTAWENKVRSVSAGATTGTLTPNSNTTDIFVASGLTGGVTFAVPTGSPTNGQRLLIRIKDDGTARALTWTTSAGGYRVIGITLPTTTVINKTTYVGCVYNSADSFWDSVATVTEA